ncbi:MAG: L-lysine 6-transaminase [Ignavibacteriae bacterium]|nr:L-lysine 6-transaminase [Ignavibacteria bacterium]MBI3363384.1 L-lysine 6-transaminase [Ignavibacteriota bacterium]
MINKNFTTGSAAADVSPPIHPTDVPRVLEKHMLVDMLDFVVDLKRSEGTYIWDSKSNRRLLDFFTFVATMPIGLNHPKMTTPEFMEKLAYVAVNKPTNSDVYTVEMAEFLETFERVAIPEYLPYAFFVEGGALGVENALKAAFDWKIRKNFMKGYTEERGKQIIHFRRAFHGRSGYTMSLTNTDPVKTNLFPKFSWPRIDSPAAHFPLNDENVKAVEKAERIAINQIKDAIRQHPDDIAAIIIEPIQGEGGDNHFRKEFFVALRQIADENEILLILDEVQTGIGLTGKMWAHQHFIQPDMISFGKKMQVCGFLCSKRIDEVPDNVFKISGRLNSTWGGNLVDMVRAQRYLEIIEEDNLVENSRIMGEYLKKRFEELQGEFPRMVSNARGRGLFCAIDLRNSTERNELRKKAFDRGLVILGSGERSLRCRPPLTIQRHEIDEAIGILRESLKEMKA